MNSRTTITIVLAVVLMVLVMGVAAAITFSGTARRDKWATSENWVEAADSVNSMKVTNLAGDGKTDLFVQAGNRLLVFDASGKQIFNKAFLGGLASSLGDVDGDGVQEIIAYYASGGGSEIAAISVMGGGNEIWLAKLPGLGPVGRVAVVDFEGTGKTGAIVGDMNGKLVAVSANGEMGWEYDMKVSELRGLDNVFLGGTQWVAAADRAGKVVVLDGNGQVAWTFNVPGGLRRLRTEELTGPKQSAVLIGSEEGTLYALEGRTGNKLWTADLGQAISEIRMAELDGDPGTREVVAGGTRNGVWAYSQTGTRLFAARVGGEKTKITEIVSLDVEDTGRDAVAIGDEYGEVTFFDAKGSKLASRSYSAPINRMTTGKLGGQSQFIVADAGQVRALTLDKQSAPFFYTPLLGGLLACVVIAIFAFVIGSMKPAPPLQLSAEEMTVEAQKARRIMLHESINDLKQMKEAGEVPSEAYMARLKDLRAQLANAEANLFKLGVRFEAETVTCPHCGGKLELGTDRCEYCGQTVII